MVNPPEKQEPNVIPPGLGLVVYSLYAGLGYVSIFFASMAPLISHQKLPAPYNKLVAVVGAAIALIFFNLDPIVLLPLFVVSLMVSEGSLKRESLVLILLKSALVGSAMSLGWLFYFAWQKGQGVFAYWSELIHSIVQTDLVKVIENASSELLEGIAQAAIFQGPFLIMLVWIGSAWFSIGFAAHLKWFEASHPLSASSLRVLKTPKWFSFTFLAGILGLIVLRWGQTGDEAITATSAQIHLLSGAFTLLSFGMLISVLLLLSEIGSYKGWGRWTRVLCYTMAMTTTVVSQQVTPFLAMSLLLLGALRPWLSPWMKIQDKKRMNFTNKGEVG